MANALSCPAPFWKAGSLLHLAIPAVFVLLLSPVLMAQANNFLPAVNYPVPGNGGLAIGNFIGDGESDIVAANQNGTVSILIGNGDGSFKTPYNVTVVPSSGPYSTYVAIAVAVGDFNADGKADLAVLSTLTNPTNPSDTQGIISILLGNGDGTFGSPAVTALDGTGPSFILPADFRNDGTEDLAVVNVVSGSVTILLGNGNGTFQSPVDYPTVADPAGFAIADLNGDGYPDLAIPGQDSGGNGVVSVLLGSKTGVFSAAVNYVTCDLAQYKGVCQSPSGIGVGDFNGDGKPDLVVSDGCAGALFTLLGNGDGTFQLLNAPAEAAGYPGTCTIAVGDFNGDGKLDVAMTQTASTNYYDLDIFAGNGDGTFTRPVILGVGIAGIDASASDVTSADLNGNQFPDLILATSGGQLGAAGYNAVTVLLNCGLACSNTVLTSAPAPSAFDQQITFTATVGPGNAKATGTPSGSVIFQDVTASPMTTLGTAMLSAGTATLQYSGLTVGTHMISATYQGDSNFDQSTSPQIAQTVTMAATTTTVMSSQDPSAPGQSVTFTVTVQPSSPVTPTGNAIMSDNGTTTVSVQLSSGTATFTTSSLTAGTHSITFSYSGNSNFMPSTSPVLTQIVGTNAAPFVLSPSASSASILAGQSAKFTITVASVPSLKTTISFACSGLPPMAACQFNPSSVTPGAGASTTLTITTTASQSRGFRIHPPVPPQPFPAVFFWLCVALACLYELKHQKVAWDRQRQAASSLVTLALIAMIAVMVACGGNSSSSSSPGRQMGTPSGASKVIVTGTAGNANQSITISLNVQ